ncbi:hypothetical protein SAMN04490189_1030 [Pseudomonas koreensis]|uniref:hypothetical protein n=1 Tax=Pseudomonas koreensis TaxID=198620 RepID=UPI00087D553F|nr:hypothetical protein [Pseudomonas koreensis]SDC95415.1 hypothetical protein SAMN04490189_1030 [Pseudomonas koreensis]
MTENLTQPGNPRYTAHALPAADEPTRNQTSEESGMQKDRHNTQSTTALLCKETGVDTLETNSLCCEAAGIIASSSSTTEALIPHEKLREAATPNATLIAQNRPPAQPVVGYKQAQLVADKLHTHQGVGRNLDLLGAMSQHRCAPHTIHLRFREKSGHYCGLLQSAANSHKRLDHFRQREVNRADNFHSHQMLFGLSQNLDSLGSIRLMQRIKVNEQHVADLSCSLGNTAYQSKYNFIALPASASRISCLFVPNVESRTYSCNASDRLNPSSCTFTRPAFEKKRNHYPKTQATRRREDYFVQRAGVDLDLCGPHKWLLAITQKSSLNTSTSLVHELENLTNSSFRQHPTARPHMPVHGWRAAV